MRLVLLGAQQRRKYGQLEQRDPSRFLVEIPQDLLERSDGKAASVASQEDQEKSANSFFSGISQLFGD